MYNQCHRFFSFKVIPPFINALPLIRETATHRGRSRVATLYRLPPCYRANHLHSHTDNLELPINITPLSAFLWTVGGNQSTGREPTKHGENMKTPHSKSPDRWWSQTLLIGPSCCDTTVLPCTPFYTNCNLLLLFGITEKLWIHMIQNRGSLSCFHRSN